MPPLLIPTRLGGLSVVENECFEDDRGFFMETWNQRDFKAAGLDVSFVQENLSRSGHNVLRGLHYQDMRAPLGKLVRCTRGRVFDVAVDLRVDSPTFGQWHGEELSETNRKQIWIPVGFAHGFQTLSDLAEVQYLQTDFYAAETEGGIRWDDPDLSILWPVTNPILSERDQRHPGLTDYRRAPAFR